MSHFDERIYVSLLEEIPNHPKPISVWLVDGSWIRKHIQKEFTNFAQPMNSAFKGKMPDDEFWIDNGANPAEIPFFIDHLLVEHYLMKRGMSYELAEKEGIKVEERERGKYKFAFPSGLEVNPELREIASLRLPDQVEPIQVFLVDGKMVRDKIDPRYCAGGHSEVYGYIPENHVWIDNTAVLREWPFYIIHELHEFRDMKEGMSYAEAHKIASRIEWSCRWNREELDLVKKELGLK